MSYIFESKRDLLYFRNYIALKNAIEQVGGSGDFVIKKCGLYRKKVAKLQKI